MALPNRDNRLLKERVSTPDIGFTATEREALGAAPSSGRAKSASTSPIRASMHSASTQPKVVATDICPRFPRRSLMRALRTFSLAPCAVVLGVTVTACTTDLTDPIQMGLAVEGDGTGSGFVSGGGISCLVDQGETNGTCSLQAEQGAAMTLTAQATSGSVFMGWSGACSGDGGCALTMDAAKTIRATFGRYQRLAVIRAGIGTGMVTSSPAGINCGSDCSEDFPEDTQVTLTALPSAGSIFDGWSGAGCTGTASCTVAMTDARAITASFGLPDPRHALTVTRSGTGSGTVTSTPSGIDCGSDCTEDFDEGTEITLSAVASSGSAFDGWSGAGCSGKGDCVVTMTGAAEVTADFTAARHALTVTRSGTGSGTVTSTPSGIDCGFDCTEDYEEGAVVTLSAVASSGSAFDGWNGAGCSGEGDCVVTMTGAKEVTADFTSTTHELTVRKSGSGRGTVTSSPSGIDCGSDCAEDYDEGAVVTLSAVASAGSTFDGWSRAGCSGTGDCVVRMSTARTVTATFTANVVTHTLTVTTSGTGSGRVTSSPSGIDCGSDCAAAFEEGAMVTLTAAPAAGSVFTGWGGGGCSGTGQCEVTLDMAKTITATFEAVYPLTVAKSGAGAGTVTSTPGGIDCGADCTEDYVAGTMVTLRTSEGAGSTFTGWSGAGCAGTGDCVVTMDAAKSVTAEFGAAFTLSIASLDTFWENSLAVVSDDGHVDCQWTFDVDHWEKSGSCSYAFASGVTVTLTASYDISTGSEVWAWTGCDTSSDNVCTVTMTGDKSISVSFY